MENIPNNIKFECEEVMNVIIEASNSQSAAIVSSDLGKLWNLEENSEMLDQEKESDEEMEKELEILTLQFYKDKLKSKDQKLKTIKSEKSQLEQKNEILSLEVAALKEENHRLLIENYTLRQKQENLLAPNPLEIARQNDGGLLFPQYDVHLDVSQISFLNNIENESKRDSKYISKIMEMVFTREELENGTITGKTMPNTYNNINQKLDERRLNFIKRELLFHFHKFINFGWFQKSSQISEMFYTRIESSEPPENETAIAERKKRLNPLMNYKIQNMRPGKKARLQTNQE